MGKEKETEDCQTAQNVYVVGNQKLENLKQLFNF